MDAAARIAGHAVVETGTHVEILGEQRWWPGLITGRGEGSDGRLVHAVEYDGYPDQEFRLNLEEETWRRVTRSAPAARPPPAARTATARAATALPASTTDIAAGQHDRHQRRGRHQGGDGEARDAPHTCAPPRGAAPSWYGCVKRLILGPLSIDIEY